MESLEQLVEQTEREAQLAEDEAAGYLERERQLRRTRLDETLNAVKAAERELSDGALALSRAARGELQAQARFELDAHSWRESRPPFRGLSVAKGTALCALLFGFSLVGGGACLTAPLAFLVGWLGRNDG